MKTRIGVLTSVVAFTAFLAMSFVVESVVAEPASTRTVSSSESIATADQHLSSVGMSALHVASESSAIISLLHQKLDGKASERVDQLMEHAGRAGVLNFPKLSAEVLNIAAVTPESERAGFLIRTALRISPKSLRVAILGTRVAFEKGLPERSVALRQMAGLITSSPSMVASILSDGSLVILLAVTLTMFLLCAAQFASAGSNILQSIGYRLPISLRGVVPPAILCLLLIFPLPFGVLAILFCWALVIGLSLPRCQWLCAGAGVLMVCWALLIPIERTLLPRVHSEIQSAVEEVNSGSAFPEAREKLITAVKNGQRDFPLVVAAAQSAMREGRLDEAEQYLQMIVGRRDMREPLRRTVYVLLGSCAFHRGDLVLAKEFLGRAEELGEKSFELYFYLAQLAIASTDLPMHQKYHALANSVNAERVRQLLLAESTTPQLSIAEIPSLDLARMLLSPLPTGAVEQRIDLANALESLSAVLFPVRDDLKRIILSAIALLLGILVRFRKLFLRALRPRVADEQAASTVWRAIPAGTLLAGDQPIRGASLLALSFCLFFVAIDSPVKSTVLHDLLRPFTVPLLACAVGLILVPTLKGFRRQRTVRTVRGGI